MPYQRPGGEHYDQWNMCMTITSSRLVVGNRLISPALPPARISIDRGFTHVGGPRFQLYGIADAEQHLFVIAGEQRTIRRLVWVQFEGFLPDNQRTYHYPVTQTVTLAGAEFIYDSSTVAIEAAIAERPDSDLAAAKDYLQAHGYRMPEQVLAQRFVHLIEPDKRNELMIIYGESAEGEEAHTMTAPERALASFSVEFL
jgi:hypothetical protein